MDVMYIHIALFGFVPLTGALIGWVTNSIAVGMIFRPRNPLRIGPFTFVGLIPKRRAELAATIGETVERELISHRDIRRLLRSPSFHGEMASAVGTRVDDLVTRYLGRGSLVDLFLSLDVAEKIKQRISREVEESLPEMMEVLLKKVEDNVDFKKIVEEKIASFELDKLESIVHSIAARELSAIKRLGGILGFLVGLVQVCVIELGWLL